MLALAGSMAFGQSGPEAKKPPRFDEVVAERFAAWDRDHDGTLTTAEIDQLCVDGTVKGAEAAAAAALKRIVRSDKYELPTFTLDYLTKAPEKKVSEAKTTKADSDREDSTERESVADKAKPVEDPAPRPRSSSANTTVKITTRPNFQSGFETCFSRIEKTDRALFKSESDLTIEHCHQGPLGDCFFVSVVGGMVKRDPEAIRKIIHERPASEGGGYTVEFGGGREVKVSPLTDAEVAISSTTSDKGGQEGVWLAVLEKGFGTLRHEDAPDKFTTESATDAIAKGGSTSTSIRQLTGHATARIAFKRRARSIRPPETDMDNRPIVPPFTKRIIMEPVSDPAKLAKTVRERVPKALDAHLLVAAGTGEEKQPPGISGKHAYAVLGYDAAKDTLTVWNPHGNTIVLKGGKEPGLANGYPTKAGVFELPVADFVRIFNGVTMETEKVSAGMERKS